MGGQRTSRSLGLLDATMIGMGAMIGAGIFVLTGLAADTAGPAALVVFLLNGGVTTFTALSYAELATAIPESGGGFAYVKETFPEGLAFVVGWMFWFAYMIAGALYALGFGANFIEFLHLYGIEIPHTVTVVGITAATGPILLGLGAIGVLSALNALSTSASGGAETVVTVAKVAILLVFVAFGLSAVDAAAFDPLFSRGELAVLPAMGLTFIAFQGYDLIATVTEEVENPRVNVPRAIFLSLAATIAVYLAVVYVAIGTLGAEALGAAGETAVAQAAEAFMPALPLLGTGAAVIAFGAVFSTISALNAVVLAASRVAFSMAREDLLPTRLAHRHARFGTPLAAVLSSSVVMLVAVVAAPIQQIGNLASLFFLLSFVMVNASAIQLRRTKPNLARPFEMPLYPWPPVLGIGLNLLLGFYIAPRTWVIGLAWVGLGLVGYAAYLALGADRGLSAAFSPTAAAASGVDIDAIRERVADELAEQSVELETLRELNRDLDAALEAGPSPEPTGRKSREAKLIDALAEKRAREADDE